MGQEFVKIKKLKPGIISYRKVPVAVEDTGVRFSRYMIQMNTCYLLKYPQWSFGNFLRHQKGTTF